MKKYILSIFLIVICYTGFGQWPITQNLGSGNTLVQVPANGGLRANLINRSYADTTSANLGYSDSYPGSLIFTTDIQAMWLRNAAADGWIQIMPSGGTGGQRPWLISGNSGLFTSPVDPQYVGTLTNQPFGVLSNGVARLTWNTSGAFGIGSGLSYGNSGEVLTSAGSGAPPTWAAASGGSIPISSLTSATGINNLEIGNNTQEWNFTDLEAEGLILESIGVAAATGHAPLAIITSGANVNNSVKSYAGRFENTHTGTTSTNVGISSTASGGTTNIAAEFLRGSVNLGTVGTESGVINFNGSTSGTVTLQPAATAGTWAMTLPTTDGNSGEFLQTNGSGVTTWAAASGATPTWQQTLTAGSTLNTTNTVDGGGNSIYFENLSDIHFEAVGIYPTTAPFMEFISVNATTNRESSIDIQDDSINIKPSLGQLHIDTLNYSANADDSMMVWSNANGGAVGMRAIPSGGATTWNAITDPTGAQALTFGAAENSVWTDQNTTADNLTINSSTGTTNSLISLNRTGTALAAGNNILELVSSGANGTNAITATGARISVTNTNATSGTNVGLAVTASGATTANYAIQATGTVVPGTNDGSAIGNTTLQWSDLFLAEGGVINWDNGDATITQTGDLLAVAGANVTIAGLGTATFPFAITNNVNGVTGFTVSNNSTGTAATIQNRLINNNSDFAYYGISGTNYSGYAPLNSGTAYFGGYNKPVSIFTQTAHSINFYPNSVLAMSILNGGAVGIGTATPSTVNGTSFASVKLQVSNAAASSYITTNTDLNIGGTGVLFNRSAASANLRLWAMDSQPDLSNTSSKFTVSSYTDAGSPTNMLTLDRNAIMGLRIPNVTTQYDNTTTTLGNVTGLSYNVTAAKKYKFTAKLFTTSDVAGGIKVAIGGTATATSIIYEGLTTDAGLTTQGRGTALGTAVAGVTAVTAAFVTIEGIIVVNASGTLTVQAACNVATATTSVLVGSTFLVTECL